MKNYKKILLLVMLFVLSITFSVRAEGDTPSAEVTLTPSATSAKVGETITVTVSVKCETGVEGLDAILTWDKTKLEFTNSEEIAVTGYSSMSGVDESTDEKLFKISMMCISSETPKETEVAVLKFKVLEEAKPDEELGIKLSNIMVANTDFEEIKIDEKELKISVVGNTPVQEEPDPEPQPEPPVQEEEKKDETVANKPINNAGLETYSFIIIAVAVIAIAFYKKCKEYKDVY